MQSVIQEHGVVTFPAFIGERVYMREFTKRDLPVDLARWQSTIDAMLNGIATEGPIFLMVDQGFVNAGNTHRRPGPHVDGRWITGIQAHGQPRPHHNPLPPEPCPVPPDPYPRHRLSVGSHGHRFDGASELLVFASDVLGCRAYVGSYEGIPASDGDCSHIDVWQMATIDMKPGIVWAGDALTLIHESIPVRYDCLRTMVRLNVPLSSLT